MRIASAEKIQEQAVKIVKTVKDFPVTVALKGSSCSRDFLIKDAEPEAVEAALLQLRRDGIFYERDGDWIRFRRNGAPDQSPPNQSK